MKDKIISRVREFKRTELEEAFDLIQVSAGEHLLKKDWIAKQNWSIFDNPVKEAAVPEGHIVERSNKLIGFIGCSCRLFKLRDSFLVAVSFQNQVVHPEHRGIEGVRFTKKCIEYFKGYVLIGTAFNKVSSIVWERFGARSVVDTDLTFNGIISAQNYINNITMSRFPNLLKYANRLGFLSYFSRLFLKIFKKTELKVFVNIYEIEYPYQLNLNKKDKIDNLCKKYSTLYDIGIYRNYEYLCWRYLKHPLYKYHIFALKKERNLIGIGIVKVVDTSRTVQVCELIYEPDLFEIEKYMFFAAMSTGKKNGGAVISSKIINYKFKEVFKELKLDVHKRDYYSYMIVAKEKNLGRVLFTYGDFKDN